MWDITNLYKFVIPADTGDMSALQNTAQ